ncbi:hypothetical protein [Silvimonas sp.]|uniref:hypothetical protein n=1 Tax=Silvimonas sp. TaxID=2650811 RepID=UPI002850C5E5|nr:hypothetical protein [Silvimonas sp.]MDR3429987.1 hypothetical protein [Silvimonas sp.]
MTRKSTKTAVAVNGKAKQHMVASFPESTEEAKATARLALRPSANAAAVVQEYAKPFGDQSIGALAEAIAASNTALADGDMKQVEAMLMGQAQALQAMFMNFSRRALKQEYQKNLESFFGMALKAQNQCRMTLQTLGEVKNPRLAVFAGQANVTSGPQQVINGAAPSRAREENANLTNELLEQDHGERLDTRAPGTASGVNQAMETVGEKHRAKD